MTVVKPASVAATIFFIIVLVPASKLATSNTPIPDDGLVGSDGRSVQLDGLGTAVQSHEALGDTAALPISPSSLNLQEVMKSTGKTVSTRNGGDRPDAQVLEGSSTDISRLRSNRHRHLSDITYICRQVAGNGTSVVCGNSHNNANHQDARMQRNTVQHHRRMTQSTTRPPDAQVL